MAVKECKSNTEIPRVSCLTVEDFHTEYFLKARPVILTDKTESWPCRQWTVESLVEKVGDNEVWVRGKTNQEDYKTGKAYTIRKAKFRDYCQDLLKGNAKARSSYLAVGSIQQSFPQLLPEVPLPEYLQECGKLHLGPYMWLALENHYEFNHIDPDDNFLVMIRGRKQVRLFQHDIESLYPNPLGSEGKTIQSQVNCDSPDMEKFPKFASAVCHHCVLQPGEMLFIPAFYWHQVTALDTGISVNFFYGDSGENGTYLEKMLNPPYFQSFRYWFLNIVEQNRGCESFPKILSRLPEVVRHFVMKHWHEVPTEEQVEKIVEIVLEHFKLDKLPDGECASKFPPILKIRGLLHRNNKIKN